MSDTNLIITVIVPIPSSRVEQAKTIVSLNDPLETFKKALPKYSSVTDKIVTSRPAKAPKPHVGSHQTDQAAE